MDSTNIAPQNQIREELEALLPTSTSPTHQPQPAMPPIEEIERRERRLAEIARMLKAEFAGLDAQIDQVIGFARSWYLLPQAQRRPTVISLWGMTGVGKSSFINRLVHHLGMSEQFMQLDLGRAVNNSFNTHVDSGNNLPLRMHRLSNSPSILFFDELHSARTVDERGQSIDRPALCDFWNLLDTGLVGSPVEHMRNMYIYMSRDLRLMRSPDLPQRTEPMDEADIEGLMYYLELKADMATLRDLSLRNRAQFMEWAIAHLDRRMRANTPLNFTQSLIFTAGNVDEIFSDSFALNPDDMNAEDLHKRTKQIGPDKIKQVLLGRFRPEQVARLGSMQIVFPSLSKASFLRLIRLKLEDLSQWVERSFDVQLRFDESVVGLILHEGVIPAQGARPVLSTITELIDCKIATWLIAARLRGEKSLTVHYTPKLQSLSLRAPSSSEALHTDILQLKEQKLPKVVISEGMRRLVAVHEAGHAVVGIVLEGRLPRKVLAGSIAWHRGGPRVEFSPREFMTKESGFDSLAICLSGLVAEELTFGEDVHSDGCARDLRQATELALGMIGQLAMGAHLGVSAQGPQGGMGSFSEEDDRLAEEWLTLAKKRARKILQAQKPLFDALVDQLLNAERLTAKDLTQTVKRHYQGKMEDVDVILKREAPRELERFAPPAKKRAA